MVSLFQTRKHSQRCPSSKTYLEITLSVALDQKLSSTLLPNENIDFFFSHSGFSFKSASRLFLSHSLIVDGLSILPPLLCILFLYKPTHSSQLQMSLLWWLFLSSTLTSKTHTLAHADPSWIISTWLSGSHLNVQHILSNSLSSPKFSKSCYLHFKTSPCFITCYYIWHCFFLFIF